MDTIRSVQNLTKIALDRLENSITMRKQAVGMDDRLIAEEQQVQLCAVLNVRRLNSPLIVELSSTNRNRSKTSSRQNDDYLYSIATTTTSC